jgi:hypothetical protein
MPWTEREKELRRRRHRRLQRVKARTLTQIAEGRKNKRKQPKAKSGETASA